MELTIELQDGSTRTVPAGTPVGDVLGENGDHLAATVDNLVVSFHYRLLRSAKVIPLKYGSREGTEVYRRTLSFILSAAASKIFTKSHVVIGHSLEGGYYFDLEGEEELDGIKLKRLEEKMRELIKSDLELSRHYVSVKEAMGMFAELGRQDKVTLLKRNYLHDIAVYGLDGFYDFPVGPLAPRTGRLSRFAVSLYPPGFVLRFPDKKNIAKMPPASDQTRLFAVYHESKKWSQILHIANVGELNETIAKRKFPDCVHVAEALHEKKIASIADQLSARIHETRLVFIAGPSSSGKTTFAKRLGVQLRVNGIRPVAIGMDDYFVDRDRTPKDDRGEYDFEALDALNVELFNDHLVQLLDGREVTCPRYDFKSGLSLPDGHTLKLEDDQVLIVEGIHGLNDRLTPRIPRNKKFLIYVSALTQLTIDDHNRIPTTDTRLIRRIVRDRAFRGYLALDTLRRWPSVIRGESRNIFPYQEAADVIFNTALLYELAVLKSYARRSLEEVPPDQSEFSEARRMLDFLHLFTEVDADAVPPTSILREFIGGSSFRY